MPTTNTALIGYGDSNIDFEIPNGWDTRSLKPKGMPRLEDPAEAVRQAVAEPISSPPLAEVLSGGGDLVIVVSDKTRITGAEIVVPVLLDTANAAGIVDEKITILFARGTHSSHTREEQEQIVGHGVASRVRLVDHDLKADDLVNIGTTPAGTPVMVNRLAQEAEKLIITGTIQLHYFAGFGGGRKSILPGICGEQTIIKNHAFTMSPKGGRNPNCQPGKLEGNELNEDMIEAAALASPEFLVNIVLNQDREIGAVFAGNWREAHRKGCETVASNFTVCINKRADIVIVTPGGYPKDINYIQSHKSFDNAFYAVRPGGVIILAAECREGIGSPIMKKWLAVSPIEEHEKQLRKHFEISGHTALAHKLKAAKVHTIIITDMADEDAALLGVERARDAADALEKAGAYLTPGRNLCYIMPEGYCTLPLVN